MSVSEYVKSWFARAEEDLATTKILYDENGSPNLSCFHAQQAGEKYLKGFLAHHDQHVRKVHDLGLLVEACLKIDHSFGQLRDDALFLSKFYIESRYPDDYIEFTREDADQAYQAVVRVKDFVLSKIKDEHK